MVQRFPRYMFLWMPRVNGYSPRGGEPRDEGEDDPPVDHAPPVEGDLGMVVAHLLVEVQLGGVEDEVGPHHVLIRDGAPARVHDRLARREVLEEVVVPREAVALVHV